MHEFWGLWEKCRCAFSQTRCWENAGELVLGMLLNMGRHTITGAIASVGNDQSDWSSVYRLFERKRVDMDKLFGCIKEMVLSLQPKEAPVIALIDDTLIKKNGKKSLWDELEA